ncbi:MAG: PIN domain-containing protein [Nanoarchaeota archaeon]
MDFVVDANVIFAALIKGNLSYRFFFLKDLHLYAPEFILIEIEKHRNFIIGKSEHGDFEKVLEVLKKRITLVPLEDLRAYIKEAEKISPDKADVSYLALALKLKIPILSNDKDLKRQNKVKVYSSQELLNLLSKSL